MLYFSLKLHRLLHITGAQNICYLHVIVNLCSLHSRCDLGLGTLRSTCCQYCVCHLPHSAPHSSKESLWGDGILSFSLITSAEESTRGQEQVSCLPAPWAICNLSVAAESWRESSVFAVSSPSAEACEL